MENALNYYTFFKKHLRKIVYITTIMAHIIVIFLVKFTMTPTAAKEDSTIFKVVDVEEFVPPVPKEEKKEEIKKEDTVEVAKQDNAADDIIETDKEIKEMEVDYLPQHKISEIPVIPLNDIKSRIVYPPLALKQGLEGVVVLQLFIDQTGKIRKVDILKDPGYGFGEAAKNAVANIKCIPAKTNGVPVAVMYRYPIRFTLTK